MEGATAVLAILACGVYLAVRRMANWGAAAVFLAVCAVWAAVAPRIIGTRRVVFLLGRAVVLRGFYGSRTFHQPAYSVGAMPVRLFCRPAYMAMRLAM